MSVSQNSGLTDVSIADNLTLHIVLDCHTMFFFLEDIEKICLCSGTTVDCGQSRYMLDFKLYLPWQAQVELQKSMQPFLTDVSVHVFSYFKGPAWSQSFLCQPCWDSRPWL